MIAYRSILVTCLVAQFLVTPPLLAAPDAQQSAIAALAKVATNIQATREGSVYLVRFSRPDVGNEHLAQLRAFAQLRYLAVVTPSVSDEGVLQIAGLSNLDTLVLSRTNLTDTGLTAVAGLSRLQRLYLENTQITDKGLEQLTGLKALHTLSLKNTNITDDGLKSLAQLPELKSLFLCGTQITDEGLACLARLNKLETLYLCDTGLTGDNVQHLLSLESLKTLNFSGTQITADNLARLAGHPTLSKLLLYHTPVTEEAAAELQSDFPQTTFYCPSKPETDSLYRYRTQKEVAGDERILGLPPASNLTDVSAVETFPGETQPGGNAANRRQPGFRLSGVPDFQRHVTPLLGRLGCNGRSCHGSFQGRGGFQLSMFGYDFAADHAALTEDGYRVDPEFPEQSAILLKPTLQEEHEGGLRYEKGGWEHQLLLKWIKAGAKRADQPAKLRRLKVTPAELVFDKPGQTTQLKVEAVWSDGTAEDVTALTRFQTNDDTVAEITADGLVEAKGRGDTYVISFYDSGVFSTQVILPVTERTGEHYPDVPTPTKIDELVVAKLAKQGIVPSELCSDEEFLRRVSLDLIGTLPIPSEVRGFVADSSPNKRARKIDELLEHPAYVEVWSNFLGDLTGSNGGLLGSTEMMQYSGQQWRSWLERRVKENAPWDEIAAGIFLATSRRPGQTYEEFVEEQSGYSRRDDPADFAADGNPMPYYWFRDNLQTPDDRTLSFGYVFLGVRLECAQCHKHPFDQWSKRDFEQLREFFTRIGTGVAGDASESFEYVNTRLGVPDKLNRAATRRQSYMRVAAEGKPIPWRETYIRPPGDEPQVAKVLGGEEIDLRDYRDPRVPLFEWLVDRDNPYFARAFVNRVWSRYFNVGIVEPVDDFNLASPPSNKALLDWLAGEFAAHGYDMKWLHRTIANSRTYQLSWVTNETNLKDEKNFSRSVIRRLPAEAVIDAIQLATANDEVASKFSISMRDRKIAVQPTSPQARRMDYSLLVFGKPLRTTNCDCERQMQPTLLQSLFVRNDEELLRWLNRPDGWLVQVADELGQILSPEVGLGGGDQADGSESALPDIRRVDQLIESAYLRTMSRPPETGEIAIARRHFQNAPNTVEGLRDLMWALLNTQEFLTNH